MIIYFYSSKKLCGVISIRVRVFETINEYIVTPSFHSQSYNPILPKSILFTFPE